MQLDDTAALPVTGATAPATRRTGRVVIASCIGTAMEWYDFFIYGYVATLVFDQLFFPKLDSLSSTLAVFTTFSVGFVARPLGALVLGHYGDRLGRKSVLMATLLMMGLSTAGIGMLPSYASIGMAAPLLLVALRLVQGLALGGESVGAVLMMVESAPAARRGLLGALVMAAAPLGIIVASLVLLGVSRLSQQQLLDGGWRLPFLFSLPLVAVGFYFRWRVEETPDFARTQAARSAARFPVAEVFAHFKRPLAVVTVAAMAETCFIYLFNVFVLSYGTKTLGMPRTELAGAIFGGNCLAFFTVPLFGSLSDRFGRNRMFRLGLVVATVYVVLFLTLLHDGDPVAIMAATIAGIGLIHPLMYGPEGSLFPEMFDRATVRFTGVSLGKQVGTTIGGGLMPLIATALAAHYHGSFVPVGLYIAVLALLAYRALSAQR
jgi:MFS transporter, MHS family, shikimate and dehydroshikimate transport protein